jgi:hypothetical protein
VEARLEDGQTVVAEISRAEDNFTAGEAVYVWWNPSDELTFPE